MLIFCGCLLSQFYGITVRETLIETGIKALWFYALQVKIILLRSKKCTATEIPVQGEFTLRNTLVSRLFPTFAGRAWEQGELRNVINAYDVHKAISTHSALAHMIPVLVTQ